MSIFKKLLTKYSYFEIETKLGERVYTKFKDGTRIPPLTRLAKDFDVKSLGYTVEEFRNDYPQYEKQKEIRTLFNIQVEGQTVSGLMKEHHVPTLFKHLENGFDFNSNAYIGKKEILKYFEFDIDLSKFKYKIYRRHTELYGSKEDLENFKEQYKINQAVLMEKEMDTWHLAFDGMMNDWIREIYGKDYQR